MKKPIVDKKEPSDLGKKEKEEKEPIKNDLDILTYKK